MKIVLKHDTKADTLNLYLSDKQATHSRQLDEKRSVDYSEDGEIVSINVSSVSSGVDTGNLPYRSAIARALTEKGFVQSAYTLGNTWFAGGSRQKSAPGSGSPGLSKRADPGTLARCGAAILIFTGSCAVSVLLTRNLFLLNSLPGMIASVFGLVAALFPTVVGCLISLAWVVDTIKSS